MEEEKETSFKNAKTTSRKTLATADLMKVGLTF